MFDKMLKKLEEDRKKILKNFEIFEKKGIYSDYISPIKLTQIKLDLEGRIPLDLNSIEMRAGIQSVSASFGHSISIPQLGVELQKKQDNYERLLKLQKMPMTKKKKEELLKRIELCGEDLKESYTQFVDMCRARFPTMVSVYERLFNYWQISNEIISNEIKKSDQKGIK